MFDFIKNKKILVASTQYPGCGGSATNAYNIIKYIKYNMGLCVSGVFFENYDKFPIDNYDPENITNILEVLDGLIIKINIILIL